MLSKEEALKFAQESYNAINSAEQAYETFEAACENGFPGVNPDLVRSVIKSTAGNIRGSLLIQYRPKIGKEDIEIKKEALEKVGIPINAHVNKRKEGTLIADKSFIICLVTEDMNVGAKTLKKLSRYCDPDIENVSRAPDYFQKKF